MRNRPSLRDEVPFHHALAVKFEDPTLGESAAQCLAHLGRVGSALFGQQQLGVPKTLSELMTRWKRLS
jgi:hypothetical protein